MFIAATDLYKRSTKVRSTNIAKAVLRYIPANTRMLDFGCGNMYLAEYLSNEIDSVLIEGIDIIQDQNLDLEKIQQSSCLDFTLYHEGRLPFNDNTFDVSLASSSLHHTHNPEFFLNEMTRVVKPGGSLIIVEEMYLNAFDKLIISSQDWIMNKLKKDVPVPLEFRSYAHYKNEFRKLGLEVLDESFLRPIFPFIHHYVFHLRNKS